MLLSERALVAHKEQTEQTARDAADRDAKERASLIELASKYAQRRLDIEFDWQAYEIPNGSRNTVYFAIDGLHLRYFQTHQDYRLYEELALGLPCPNEDASVLGTAVGAHDLVYVTFHDLGGLGALLVDRAHGDRSCWQCQERAENAPSKGVARHTTTAIERLEDALHEIIRAIVEETTGAS